MTVLVIVGSVEMGLWGKRWQLSKKSVQEVRMIPFGSVTKNIRFLPNEEVIKIQAPPVSQKSNWIEAPAGKKIVAETPSNSDGSSDPKSWVCMELSNGMQRCSHDPDPPKDFHQNTYAIRVWGQGGDGYIPVSVY